MFRNLGSNANPVHVQGSATSYFSAPESELDPRLFSGMELKGWVRNGILHLLFDFLKERYTNPESWSHVWIAGSGVSYQWSAAREPGDLDVLIGVDYIKFRRSHPQFAGLSDVEISKMLNEDFRNYLQPDTANWNGFEVTFYVNPGATDIRSINPYAAYDLTHNEWTVHPTQQGAPHNVVWDEVAKRDLSMAMDITTRYTKASTELDAAMNDAARRNAEARLHAALNTKTTASHCCKTTVIPKAVRANPVINTTTLRCIGPRFFFHINGWGTTFPAAVHPSPFSGILADISFNDIRQFLDIVLNGFFIRCFALQIKMLFDHQCVSIAIAPAQGKDRQQRCPGAHGKNNRPRSCPGFLAEKINVNAGLAAGVLVQQNHQQFFITQNLERLGDTGLAGITMHCFEP